MIFSKEEEKEKVKECDRLPSDSAYFTTSESKARLLLNSQNQQSPLPGNTNLHQKKVCGTFKDSILNFFLVLLILSGTLVPKISIYGTLVPQDT